MAAADTSEYLAIEQLRVGIYIHLDLPWTEHPFSFGQFIVKSEQDLATLRRLGLRRVRWSPDKSLSEPLPAAKESVAEPAPSVPLADWPEIQAKKARLDSLRQQGEALGGCRRDYLDSGRIIKSINQNLLSKPQESIDAAMILMGKITESLLAAQDVSIQLMHDKEAGEEVYHHSLNVAVLAMLLGRELGLPAEALQLLGLGGLFHDIGKLKIPHKVLMRADDPSKAEAEFLQRHCQYGVGIGQKAQLPPEVIRIIAQHHEAMDGSGYPAKLQGDQIYSLARIVAVVNVYDNLCNPINVMKAVTPHEALAMMYAQQRTCFDLNVLGKFIRLLGVYPPGSLVRLSNDAYGVVTAVNTAKSTKPCVMIYDPEQAHDELIVLNLAEEPQLSIVRAIRPSQLPGQVYEKLSPRKRVSYFFDSKRRETTLAEGA